MSEMLPGGKTPLTEQQARSLAHWWGGTYQTVSPIVGDNHVRHGVIVSGGECQPVPHAGAGVAVFSLEEAREMENRRGFQDAASPDWIG
jgi:hypothetical protein